MNNKTISAILFLSACFLTNGLRAQWYSYTEFKTTGITKTVKAGKEKKDAKGNLIEKAGDQKKLCNITTERFPGTTAEAKAFFDVETPERDSTVDSLKKEVKLIDTLIAELTKTKTGDKAFDTPIDKRIAVFNEKKAALAKEIATEEKRVAAVSSKEGIFSLEHAYLNYLTQSKRIAVYSEVMHDYIGPVRVSLGLMFAAPAKKDSAKSTKASDSVWEKKSFIDKFRSGGGIAQLNFSYPLLHLQIRKYADLKLFATPRFAIDIPREDTTVQRFAHHTQLNAEAQLKINTLEENFTFLLCWKGMMAWGNSTFYDNMGFVGSSERKRFNFNTWTVGFIAKKKVAVYYTWYSGDTRATRQVGETNNHSLTTNYKF